MMFDKPVSDPTAKLLFVGQGIKGRFCVESQPDGGKTGFNHFHRTHTPSSGDMSMHGAKGEEGYWLKHVAVAEFDDEPKGEHAGHGGKTHYKPGQVEQRPSPRPLSVSNRSVPSVSRCSCTVASHTCFHEFPTP